MKRETTNNYSLIDIEQFKRNKAISISNLELLNQFCPDFFNETVLMRQKMCFSIFEHLHIKKKDSDFIKDRTTPRGCCKKPGCKNCNSIKGSTGYEKLLPIIKLGKSDLNFITLTFPNIPMDKFNKNIGRKVTETYGGFSKKSRKIKRIGKNVVRKTEMTINYETKSYNLHFHCLVGSVLTEQDKQNIREYGTSCFKRNFSEVEIKTSTGLLNVDFQKVKRDKIEYELTGYISKGSVDSIKKDDIEKTLYGKGKKTTRKDKKEHFKKQFYIVKNLSQDEITELHVIGFVETKNKNFFNVSGFEVDREKYKEQVKKEKKSGTYYSFLSYQNGLASFRANDIYDYLLFQYQKQVRYQKQRKVKLTPDEMIERIVQQAPFEISEQEVQNLKTFDYIKNYNSGEVQFEKRTSAPVFKLPAIPLQARKTKKQEYEKRVKQLDFSDFESGKQVKKIYIEYFKSTSELGKGEQTEITKKGK